MTARVITGLFSSAKIGWFDTGRQERTLRGAVHDFESRGNRRGIDCARSHLRRYPAENFPHPTVHKY